MHNQLTTFPLQIGMHMHWVTLHCQHLGLILVGDVVQELFMYMHVCVFL